MTDCCIFWERDVKQYRRTVVPDMAKGSLCMLRAATAQLCVYVFDHHSHPSCV